MDMELKSLLYVVLKNQCRILAKLEKISTDVQDEGLNNLEDPNDINKRPKINRLLALATPGETKNTYPKEINKSRIPYKRLLLSRDSSSKNS